MNTIAFILVLFVGIVYGVELGKELGKPDEENAKLKEENAELKSIAQFQQSSNMDAHLQLKRSNERLTKAKEILHKFLATKNIEETCAVESEAEQFLKEVSE